MDFELSIVDNILDNIKDLRKKLPKPVLLSMVLKNYFTTRSLSYVDIGILVYKNTKDVDVFCIIDVLDGIKLREHGVTIPLVLLYWHPAEKADIMSRYQIQPAVLNKEWIKTAEQVLQQANITTPLLVHLWIDVGMGREGVNPEDSLSLATEIHKSPYLKLHGIGAHFPEHMVTNENCTKWIKHGIYDTYQSIFEKSIEKLTKENLLASDVIIHAATSNMIFLDFNELYYNMARIGTLIYYGNKPYQTFYQPILQIKEISLYSYNHKHFTHPTRVAMIELSGNRLKKMEFWLEETQLYELQPGIFDVSDLKCKIGDPIKILVKYKI